MSSRVVWELDKQAITRHSANNFAVNLDFRLTKLTAVPNFVAFVLKKDMTVLLIFDKFCLCIEFLCFSGLEKILKGNSSFF
jgi:hypothetical protein